MRGANGFACRNCLACAREFKDFLVVVVQCRPGALYSADLNGVVFESFMASLLARDTVWFIDLAARRVTSSKREMEDRSKGWSAADVPN